MHLGVLATAWHAINTKSMFIAYYNANLGMLTCPRQADYISETKYTDLS
jgi:hypothetical protein